MPSRRADRPFVKGFLLAHLVEPAQDFSSHQAGRTDSALVEISDQRSEALALIKQVFLLAYLLCFLETVQETMILDRVIQIMK